MISFPFTSIKTISNGNLSFDRAIDSDTKRLQNSLLYTEGVDVRNPSAYKVMAGSGMTVDVMCDGAWALCYGVFAYEKSATRTLALQAADATKDRIDRIVLRTNLSQDSRSADLYVVTGTASSAPVAPELTRTTSIYEIALADVYVPMATTETSSERITDQRLNAELCGTLGNAFGSVDPTPYFTQIEALIESLETEIKNINAGTEAMLKTTYDPQGRSEDIFAVTDGIYAQASKLYHSLFLTESWTASGSDFTQTVTVDGVTSATELGAPMCKQTNNADTNATLQGALSIINMGFTETGNGTVTIKTFGEKPTCDIELFWWGR